MLIVDRRALRSGQDSNLRETYTPPSAFETGPLSLCGTTPCSRFPVRCNTRRDPLADACPPQHNVLQDSQPTVDGHGS